MDDTMRILIVDDEVKVLFVLYEVLTGLDDGVEVLTAQSGQQALETIKQDKINLLITDLKMPDMNGVELTQRARALNPNLHVIWITAYDAWATDAEKLHIDHYLHKPLEIQALRTVVQQALGSSPTG
jgi:YesN/AraC family two-component response regulator